MVKKSSRPTLAATNAPTTPITISHSDPRTRKAASSTTYEPMSKPRLATQVPIGTVTRIGWNGCPYGPARAALTGRFARYHGSDIWVTSLCADRGVEPASVERNVSTHGDWDDPGDRATVGRRRGCLVGLVRAGVRRCRSTAQRRDAVHVRGRRGGRYDDEGSSECSGGCEANGAHSSSLGQRT